MNVRTGAAVVAARLAGSLSRGLRRGGGTALPGLVAERIAPDLLAALAAQLPQGAVVVTGTNGKTTTSHMLAGILRRAGLQPLRNASGSNLARGLATTLAADASWSGTLKTSPNTVAVFETDEAAFAGVVPAVRPRAIVVTNLFRDQLDRYGEVDAVAARWRHSLDQVLGPQSSALSPTVRTKDCAPALVLNADDPTVAALGDGREHASYFGIEDARWGKPGPEHASDAKVCPRCGELLAYPVCFYGHLGHYTCPNGHVRPTPAVRAAAVEPRGFAGSDLTLALPSGELRVRLPLPGLYNVYNALAAAGAASAIGVSPDAIKAGLEAFTAAFGRLERVEVEGRIVYLVLAKNPVGMNEALRTLVQDGEPKRLLMALNDLDADGRDVSWIWDADFEHVAGKVRSLVVSGRRAEDLAVRLKYAGALSPSPAGSTEGDSAILPDLAAALDAALRQTPRGETLYCVLTYTAMLALRRVLTDRGYIPAYWKDE
jgi:UDP-N-acetylmuramyl tripeptide synthase